ncbi:hypothetical protein B0O99DRAFT_681432 [Bisporella sp. PMI_857]|nr:hypothetical protein B0O99DRAFT_681432 [Bisporella sp. PMI_857]
MDITIRPALASDIDTLASLDFLTNADQPLGIPWSKPADGLAVFTSRFRFLFHNSSFRFLVAGARSDPSQILGFIVWKLPGGSDEDWKPEFPEGTKVNFLDWYLGGIDDGRKTLGIDLDTLYVLKNSDE